MAILSLCFFPPLLLHIVIRRIEEGKREGGGGVLYVPQAMIRLCVNS